MTDGMNFSSAISILKDIKKKSSWDIIKVIEKLDEKPITFDFGAGNIIVIRYVIETIDARLMLFVPAVKSFMKKILVGKYFELGSKRTYNYELSKRQTSDWIIYVNRIKNLNQIKFTLKQRILWQKVDKQKDINFPFDENWLEKCLPIKNNIEDCQKFFEKFEDVDKDTLLSEPLKVLRMQFNQQIEVNEYTGSVIKNLEYYALTHNRKIVKIYVPYFLKDLVSNLIEKFLNFNIVINRLKIFFKRSDKTIYGGFLWDPTLSGFITHPKEQEEKVLSIKDCLEEFDESKYNQTIQNLTEEFSETEKQIVNNKQKGPFKNNFKNKFNKQGGNQKKYHNDEYGEYKKNYQQDEHTEYKKNYQRNGYYE
jgi:hypothetical protein